MGICILHLNKLSLNIYTDDAMELYQNVGFKTSLSPTNLVNLPNGYLNVGPDLKDNYGAIKLDWDYTFLTHTVDRYAEIKLETDHSRSRISFVDFLRILVRFLVPDELAYLSQPEDNRHQTIVTHKVNEIDYYFKILMDNDIITTS